jgi:hypothetical protein
MYSRTLGLVAAASLFIVACGGDDTSTAGGMCVGTEMSVPGMPNDPCPQDNAACVAAGGKAYAACVGGTWAKTCECMTGPGSTGSMQMPTVQAQAICGDTVIGGDEKCDRTNLNGATCQTLGYNGGGMLLCNMTSCLYDTIMCRMTTSTGTGGTNGGAGTNGGGGTGGT